ncbi:MAG: methyltransferase domain-containing protein [Alphaproteobacteria bacterium]|nr:methyltransferase domain-containing protein [Alphaproteobacteria bacterium]
MTATTPPGASHPALIFDRDAVRAHRDRAAPRYDDYAFLKREVAQRLAERLEGINRTFNRVLDLGAHDGSLGEALLATGKVGWVAAADPSGGMARRNTGPALVADEEVLPVKPGSLDMVASALSLHWVNDLPGALLQIKQALRPDGLFLAAMLGGETLSELRACLAEAESAVEGGISPRISPMADLRDAGALMQRAGFALPVVDSDVITVTYGDALSLMRDLKGMGESGADRARLNRFTRRRTLLEAARLYQERYAGPDGRIPATFQVLHLTGWSPAATQQQPLRPGQAKTRLADALGAVEKSAGEKAGR